MIGDPIETLGRKCAWCGEPIKRFSRKDAETCTKKCRQARHRFRITPATKPDGRAMKFGFADPPYVGLSKRYYEEHPAFAGEVDHRELIQRMCTEYADGWALCGSSPSLQYLLALCPYDVRVAVWAKGSRAGISHRARDAYEIVILRGGRELELEPTQALDNVLAWGGRQHSHPDALVGMKPAPFCEWVFRMLGAGAGDELADLFPGSGAVTRAWRIYSGLGDVDRPQQLGLFGFDPEKRSDLPSRLEEASARSHGYTCTHATTEKGGELYCGPMCTRVATHLANHTLDDAIRLNDRTAIMFLCSKHASSWDRCCTPSARGISQLTPNMLAIVDGISVPVRAELLDATGDT